MVKATMKLLLVVFSLLLSFSPALAAGPLPRQLSTGSSALKLSPSFTISFSGVQNPSDDINDAVMHTINHLTTDRLDALVVDMGASCPNLMTAASLDSLLLTVQSEVEGYILSVPADGSAANLQANSILALLKGLTTFEQLWSEFNGRAHLIVAPIVIVDR